MKVVIFSPREKLYEDNAREVILPGADGEFSVWDFHQPFIYRLSEGDVRIVKLTDEAHKIKRLAIADGMAKMNKNELTIMAETAQTRT